MARPVVRVGAALRGGCSGVLDEERNRPVADGPLQTEQFTSCP
jgi:hypothetical protein